jgi:PAS domain S-box-containing protein
MRIIPAITGIFAAAIVALPLCVIFVTVPAFTRLAEDNARQESLRVASHLAASLVADNGDISGGLLPKEFPVEAEKVRRDFSLLRLRVIAPSGEIVFSTNKVEIGRINRAAFFREMVLRGVNVSEVIRRGHESLEGETVETDVAETYVPLTRDGRIIGAFEIYYDISERIANLDRVMARANLLLFVVAAVLLTITSAVLFRARRIQAERDLAREEWEKTFEAVTDPVMIVTRDFTIARANKAMADWIGVSKEEAVGLTCHRKVHNCNDPIAGCPHKKLLEDGTAHTAEIYDKQSGRYFSVAVYPLLDSRGELSGSVHYAKDITVSKLAVDSLQESEEKFKGLAASAQDAIIMMDESGNISFWNKSAATVFGYDPEEAIGMEVHRLIVPERFYDDFRQGFARFQATGEGEFVGRTLELLGRKKDGTEFPVEFSVSALRMRGKWQAISILRDITDRKRSEELIQQQLKNMTALSDIGIAISSTLDVRVTLNILLDRLISQLGIDAAAILLMDQESLYLKCAASLGFRTQSIRSTSVRMGKGHAGKVAFERQTLIIPDMSDTLTSSLKEEGFRSYVGVPLIVHGKVAGVLELFHRNPIDLSDEWLGFIELMAAQAAIAIDNATMFNNLQRTNAELTLSYDATLEGWGRTLELRDEDTKGHTERVAGMAVQFARLMGLDDKAIVQLRRGAMLHDIGKIGIPDAILLKPGPLDPEEREIMQRHTTYAYELLKPIPFLHAALDIPYCHHEKWDGSGTPRGLQGEAIPLFARIFAVVDVWDALMSDRPYRSAWPLHEVKAYIEARSGTEFDPQVVEIFLRYLEDECSEDIWNIRGRQE